MGDVVVYNFRSLLKYLTIWLHGFPALLRSLGAIPLSKKSQLKILFYQSVTRTEDTVSLANLQHKREALYLLLIVTGVSDLCSESDHLAQLTNKSRFFRLLHDSLPFCFSPYVCDNLISSERGVFPRK